MDNESEAMRMVEWFRTLSLPERKEKIKSMHEFFAKNTTQLIKTVKSLEEVKNCPQDLIVNAKALIANNMKIMNTLESIERGVDNAEKESNSQPVETGTTSAGE